MKLTTAEVIRRLRNWKTIVAITSLLGFIATEVGHVEVDETIKQALPYIYSVGISLGIITSHGSVEEDERNEE
ncbi:hypothetical protein OCD65_27965 [Bacillus paranthracis]|uniref:hypothetical protein n=1 Tax=Bacillus cereus group TaxID=86661 RepID=UPI001F5AED04|nr:MULTISPECIES: hypothetical protein [Bacillus cereus group]MCU5020519.1 hypothetical protein [Bacillus paranthracis]